MLLYPFSALLTTFPETFILKRNTNNGRNLPSCAFLGIGFTNDEATGCINEEAIGVINETAICAIIARRNPPYYYYYYYYYYHYFILRFTVSVALSINRPDFSCDSTILITSAISSF